MLHADISEEIFKYITHIVSMLIVVIGILFSKNSMPYVLFIASSNYSWKKVQVRQKSKYNSRYYC